MTALRTVHPLKGEPRFVWRGGDPTRVEALSDMVFAFALTLLVVSADPPSNFAELQAQLWGFPGFAAAFAMLLILWHAHYIFFRRYGLADAWTTTLNAAFLFLILFFVYPLKYLATMLSQFVQSLAAGTPAPPMSIYDAQQALILLSIGYAAVFAVLAALYLHARGKAELLQLTAEERARTRFSLYECGVHAAVAGAVAVIAAFAPVTLAPWAGFLFFLIGPLIGVLAATILPGSPKRAAQATAQPE